MRMTNPDFTIDVRRRGAAPNVNVDVYDPAGRLVGVGGGNNVTTEEAVVHALRAAQSTCPLEGDNATAGDDPAYIKAVSLGLQARLEAAGLAQADVTACAAHRYWHTAAREVLAAVLVLLPETGWFHGYVKMLVEDRREYAVAEHRKNAPRLVDESLLGISRANGEVIGHIRARNLITARLTTETRPEVREVLEALRREVVASANAVKNEDGGDNG